MICNFFLLFIDVFFSGLYWVRVVCRVWSQVIGVLVFGVCLLFCVFCVQGMKVWNFIYVCIEENICVKICWLWVVEVGEGCKDVLQFLIEYLWERGERLDMQVSGSFRRGIVEFVFFGFVSVVFGVFKVFFLGVVFQSGQFVQILVMGF